MRLSKTMNKIGLVLMCLYIFMSYNAVDIVIPSSMNSLFLYAFVGWGALSVLASLFTTGKIQITEYTLWYGAFMIVSLVSMIYSPEQSLLSGSYYLMIVSFIMTFIFLLVIKDEKSFTILCWAYFISSISLFFMLAFNGYLEEDGRLGQDFMDNANGFSTMISTAAMYGLWLLVYGKHRLPVKIVIIIGLLLDMYALILSGGRRGFMLPFIFLYMLLLVKADAKGRKHILTYTAIIGVLVIIAYNLIMNVPELYDAIGYRFEGFLNGVFGEGSLDSSSAIRDEIRILAFDGWKTSPLWGHGFDSFKYYCETKTGHFFYSHCNYTEMLYNGGLLTFFVYYWIYILLSKKYRIKKDLSQTKFKAFAVASAVTILFGDFADMSYTALVFQTLLAVSFVCLDFKKNGPSIRSIR